MVCFLTELLYLMLFCWPPSSHSREQTLAQIEVRAEHIYQRLLLNNMLGKRCNFYFIIRSSMAKCLCRTLICFTSVCALFDLYLPVNELRKICCSCLFDRRKGISMSLDALLGRCRKHSRR